MNRLTPALSPLRGEGGETHGEPWSAFVARCPREGSEGLLVQIRVLLAAARATGATRTATASRAVLTIRSTLTAGAALTVRAAGTRRAILIGCEFAVAVLIELLQRLAGLGEFFGIDNAIVVQVQRFNDGTIARSAGTAKPAGAARASGPTVGATGAAWTTATGPLVIVLS